jgi:integrase
VRDVPISDALLPIVTDMLIKLPGDHPLYDIDGLPFDISYLSAFISRTSKQIGIDFNMYMCRHSLKRSMREAGVDPRIQQDILGHASYKTSIGYDRSTEKEREEALNHLPA